eukprot:TRINITY_DN5887_c0_g1_i1.p2 TRINITY_DN5887_c0_g1~~TRINITY_DN5887_c0_g1_i1.p2  ORF type:complete len:134 (-),score=35.33 TRINITY_DN5887_c0_g1_i1:39-440(-)
MTTCDIPESVVTEFKKWTRTREYPAVCVMKINVNDLAVEIEEYHNLCLEDLQEELPDATPRFVAIIHELDKGDRKAYPMSLIYYAPPTSTTLATLYSSTLSRLQTLLIVPKTFRVDDVEELTTEWLEEQLLRN